VHQVGFSLHDFCLKQYEKFLTRVEQILSLLKKNNQ